jgi:hypothetical protein
MFVEDGNTIYAALRMCGPATFLSIEPGYDFANKLGVLYIGVTSNKCVAILSIKNREHIKMTLISFKTRKRDKYTTTMNP